MPAGYCSANYELSYFTGKGLGQKKMGWFHLGVEKTPRFGAESERIDLTTKWLSSKPGGALAA